MKITRLLSSSFLVLAMALVAFRVLPFCLYTGAYYDELMILFDPFLIY
jgi:hypothetical protein